MTLPAAWLLCSWTFPAYSVATGKSFTRGFPLVTSFNLAPWREPGYCARILCKETLLILTAERLNTSCWNSLEWYWVPLYSWCDLFIFEKRKKHVLNLARIWAALQGAFKTRLLDYRPGSTATCGNPGDGSFVRWLQYKGKTWPDFGGTSKSMESVPSRIQKSACGRKI